MENISRNYNTNNQLFKYIILSVLSFIGMVYYMLIKKYSHINLSHWYDWGASGLLLALAAYYALKVYRQGSKYYGDQ